MGKNKKSIGIILVIGIIFVFTIIYIQSGKGELSKNKPVEKIFEASPEKADKGLENKPIEETEFVVDIKGEIKNPGVYYVKKDSILEDLIKKAGGVTKDGDLTSINRASKLQNNQAIIIPNKKDSKKIEIKSNINNSLAGGENNDSGKININTATLEELDKINGVGEAKAKAILTYREEKGGFKNIEDIKNVAGIGNATFEKIKDSITI